MTKFLDIVQLQAILENIHTWAMRVLRPWISTYIDQWRYKFLEDPDAVFESERSMRLVRASTIGTTVTDDVGSNEDGSVQSTLLRSLLITEHRNLLTQIERLLEKNIDSANPERSTSSLYREASTQTEPLSRMKEPQTSSAERKLPDPSSPGPNAWKSTQRDQRPEDLKEARDHQATSSSGQRTTSPSSKNLFGTLAYQGKKFGPNLTAREWNLADSGRKIASSISYRLRRLSKDKTFRLAPNKLCIELSRPVSNFPILVNLESESSCDSRGLECRRKVELRLAMTTQIQQLRRLDLSRCLLVKMDRLSPASAWICVNPRAVSICSPWLQRYV